MPKGELTELKLYDFKDKDFGKAIPYEFDITANNEGLVNIGINHDTAAYSDASITSWRMEIGK
jgi:hypothetical protein